MVEHLETERAAWLAVHRTPGIGAVTFLKLLSVFQHPRYILEANRTQLSECSLSNDTIDSLLSPDWPQIEKRLSVVRC